MYVESVVGSIEVTTDFANVRNRLERSYWPKTLIPSFAIRNDDVPKETVSIRSGSLEQQILDGAVDLSFPREPDDLRNLEYLLLYRFQRIYQEHEHYYFHATALSSEDSSTIVIGPSFAGKTTVALAALQAGYAVHGDDGIVISADLHIKGGNRVMLERTSHGKSPITLPEPGASSPAVNRIVLIRPYGPHSGLTSVPRSSALPILLEESARDIRGIGYYLSEHGVALPSLDRSELSERRFTFIEHILDDCEIMTYIGPPNSLAEALLQP